MMRRFFAKADFEVGVDGELEDGVAWFEENVEQDRAGYEEHCEIVESFLHMIEEETGSKRSKRCAKCAKV